MVRPQASPRNKELALLVAKVITTTPSFIRSPCKDTIGRCGEHSMYDVFSKVCPSATRDHSRTGVTEAELNKVLEKDGFLRVRVRSSIRQLENMPAKSCSFYSFGKRRWRNPDDADDMAAIAHMWQSVSQVAECVPLEEIANILRETLVATKSLSKGTIAASCQQIPSASVISHFKPRRVQMCSKSESPCSQADTEEQSSRTPVFPPTDTDDDEELQEKLAKEEFSAEGLPAFQYSSNLVEAPSDGDSAYGQRSSVFDASGMTARDIELLCEEDNCPSSLCSEGLMAILGMNNEPTCCD